MKRTLWAVGWALLLAWAAPAAAQEMQVPLDERGRVEVVDRRLAQRLGLWVDEYPGFVEARLFQGADSSFVLEITTETRGRTERRRVPLSAEQARELRRDLAARMAEQPQLAATGALDQEGRYLLLGQTTLAGIGFYGWAVPYVLDADDTGAAGMYLLTAAGSFFLPFALTADAPVTYGMANLSRYGITRGALHGLLLHNLLAGEETVSCVPDRPCDDYYDGSPDRGRVGAALVMSLAEGIAGYAWARGERMPAGTANAIVAGGDAGMLWGLGTATALGLDPDHDRTRAGSVLGVAGAAAGIYGGYQLAQRRDYTWGDADVLYTGAAVGGFVGFAVATVLDESSEPLHAGAAVVASAAGAYAADRLLRDTDFTTGQAALNRLGAVAGALAGASLGVMTESEDVAAIGSAAGALLGYYGTYGSLAPRARERRGEERGDRMAGLSLRVHPEAVLLGGSERPAPMLSLRYRF